MEKNVVIWIIVALIIGGGIGYWTGNGYGAGKYGNGASMSMDAGKEAKAVGLRDGMRQLWAEHMQWTYATVDAFYHNPKGLQANLDRLLQNQKDIGAAVVAYYGKDAGDKLTALLTTHIQQAVPVLQAAQANDTAALDKALSDWYKNADDIAAFLSAANPESWPESVTKPMMKHHIETTTAYAVDLLKGDYAKAITDYGAAYAHMMMLADALSGGIVKQFPDKF